MEDGPIRIAKLKVAAVSDGPAGVGSTFRSEQVFVGKPRTVDIEIVEFDRGRRFSFKISQRKQGGGKDVHFYRRRCRARTSGWVPGLAGYGDARILG